MVQVYQTWHTCILSASSVHHQCITSASSVHHQCIISVSSVHHQGVIISASSQSFALFTLSSFIVVLNVLSVQIFKISKMMATPQVSFYPQCFADHPSSYNQNWLKENMPSNRASRPHIFRALCFQQFEKCSLMAQWQSQVRKGTIKGEGG